MIGVRKDAIGFGALNADLLYTIEDFSLVQRVRPDACRGGEYLVSEAEMSELRRLLERHGHPAGRSGGGQAANAMLALARMGFATAVVGAVGEDAFGTFLLETLSGVDTSRVLRMGQSGLCLIAVDETRDRTSFVLPNANDAVSGDLLDSEYLNSASFVHLSSFAGDAPFEAQREILPLLKSPRTSFDPGALYCRKGLDALGSILKRTCVTFVTEQEMKELTGLEPDEGATKLIESGTRIVACKRGRRGARLYTPEGTHDMPAPEVNAVDPTGAGDVFAAGFIAGLLLDRPLAECGRFAAQVAAHSVTGFGRERYPDAEMLRRGLGLSSKGVEGRWHRLGCRCKR